MVLFFLDQLLCQRVKVLINQSDYTVYSVPSLAIQEILSGKGVRSRYDLIQKSLDECPVLLHITDIVMFGKPLTLKLYLLHHLGQSLLEVRFFYPAGQHELKGSVCLLHSLSLLYRYGLLYLIDLNIQ